MVLPNTKFDLDLYQKIRNLRENNTLYRNNNEELANHPLKGRRLQKISNGDVYTIQSVHKMWHKGYFLCLLTEKNGSHGQVYWENINCLEDMILNHIEEGRLQYTLVE